MKNVPCKNYKVYFEFLNVDTNKLKNSLPLGWNVLFNLKDKNNIAVVSPLFNNYSYMDEIKKVFYTFKNLYKQKDLGFDDKREMMICIEWKAESLNKMVNFVRLCKNYYSLFQSMSDIECDFDWGKDDPLLDASNYIDLSSVFSYDERSFVKFKYIPVTLDFYVFLTYFQFINAFIEKSHAIKDKISLTDFEETGKDLLKLFYREFQWFRKGGLKYGVLPDCNVDKLKYRLERIVNFYG